MPKDVIHQEKILILDFGSQYTQLITRRIRENHVYSEIFPYNAPFEKIKKFNPKGILLSGSPSSVTDEDAPICREIFDLGVPVLGICYGMQLITYLFGGRVAGSSRREYGRAHLQVDDDSDILAGFADGKNTVWMSHGDRIEALPEGFVRIAHTENSPVAVIKNPEKKIYALQFHPEVVHTPNGNKIIQNFIYNICGCTPGWTMHSFMEQTVESIRETVGDGKVICGLSGGVDSSVTAVLIHKAIGKNLTSIFVNNGLLRKNEVNLVLDAFKEHMNLNLVYVDAADRFLEKLENVTDPEEKRKIIGREFIAVFEEAASSIGEVDFLAQGTLYPDVIESVSFKGPSATIKSHHNVGGLPDHMKMTLVEPLRELFKDEVRELGRELGIADELIGRHPFPGPGLAVRILDAVTVDQLELLRDADAIFIEEITKAGLYNEIWQAFAVLLPVKTVGVMGDQRTYENVIALRAVTSMDGMTADWAVIPPEVLGRVSNRIINEVKGANRVVYDISSKPPSTIEWE